jgi:thiamine-phosphate pyrophosphorylase
VTSGRIPNAKPQLPSLNAIVDADVSVRAGWRPVDLARAFLEAGVTFLQFRAKTMTGAELLETAAAIVELAHAHDGIVIVNDRADIARLARADGVHLGQDDLSPAAARRVVGADAIVGLSTHTTAQQEAAVGEPVSYVAIGPVFATTTKSTGHGAGGLDMVRAAASRARAHGLPLVAIGGITLESAGSVLEAGADSVAVIGDLLATGDPAARARDYLHRLASTGG